MSHQANEAEAAWNDRTLNSSLVGYALSGDTDGVRIASLKRWASSNLRSAPRLRFLILSERDELPRGELLVKMELWLKLLAEESKQIRRGYSDRF